MNSGFSSRYFGDGLGATYRSGDNSFAAGFRSSSKNFHLGYQRHIGGGGGCFS